MLHPFSSFCGNCGILPIFEYIRIFEYETERMSNIRIFKKPIFFPAHRLIQVGALENREEARPGASHTMPPDNYRAR